MMYIYISQVLSLVAGYSPATMYSVHSMLNGTDNKLPSIHNTKPYESPLTSPTSPTAQEDRRKTPSSWDPNDDMVLRHLKEQLKLGWKEIASHFPNRTTNACQFRWRRLMSGTLRSSNTGHSSVSSPPQQTQSPPTPTTNELNTTNSNDTSSNSNNTNQAYLSPALSVLISKEEEKQKDSNGDWSHEEDQLMLSRQDLNPDELSLLLPLKTERQITDRISILISQGKWASKPPSLVPTDSISSTSSTSSSCTFSRASTSPPPPPPSIKFSASSFEGLKLPTPIIQTREPSASATLLNVSL